MAISIRVPLLGPSTRVRRRIRLRTHVPGSCSPQASGSDKGLIPLVYTPARAAQVRWRPVVDGAAQSLRACEGATPPWVQIPPPPPHAAGGVDAATFATDRPSRGPAACRERNLAGE